MDIVCSLETTAIIVTHFYQTLLRVSPYAKEQELNRFANELDQELSRQAVQAATEIVQARMLEGLYESVEMMNQDLEFQIKIQKRIRNI